MMPVALRPMTPAVYQAYLQEHEEDYARDRMITDRQSFEQALQTTRAQHQATLPQGLQTPDHYFFTVEDEQRPVGYVWFSCRPSTGQLFLYHILIKAPERRRGYGRLALQAIERKAQELGCRAIWLNVMAHNPGAIDFYLANGYQTAAIHMSKHLGAGDS
jgi:ribosomal protein S18 acetylase RimI-like enzyme